MAEGSLEFYCGSLGSGKTALACERAMLRLLQGGTVVSNIEWHRDALRKWFHEEHGLEFDDERLINYEDGVDFWKHAVKGNDNLATMLLVDEAHVEHDCADHKKTQFEEKLLNTMARKLKIDLVYITQDMDNVNAKFRRMKQVVWYCRNAAQVPILGFFKFPLRIFFRVPYFCGPGAKPRMGQPEITLRPISWGMYKTDALVGRAASTFSVLATAKTSPLKRIPRPPRPFPWHVFGPIAAALTVFLS